MSRIFSFPETVPKITVLILFILIQTPAPAMAGEFRGTGVITAACLNVRSGPGRKYRSVTVLDRGTEVRVIGKEGEWFKISHRGKYGFVRNRERYIRVRAAKKTRAAKKKISHRKAPPPENSEDIRLKIKSRKMEVKEFTQQESREVERLNEIDRKLNNASKNVSAARKQLKLIESSIIEITAREKSLTENIKKNRVYADKRLNALYRISRAAGFSLPEESSSIMDHVRSRAAMKYIIANDLNFLGQLEADKKECLDIRNQLEIRQREKTDLKARLDQELMVMNGEKKKRSDLLEKIRKKRSMALAAISALKKSAIELDKKVTSLKKSSPPEKKPEGNSFSSFKGLLKPPVKGKITSYFGRSKNSNDRAITFQNGINIKASRGSPIRSVAAGQVLFADWFKGYGNMIIIDHGNSYYSLYARAEELFKSKGDTVEKREVIATVGSTASMEGPSLHFEIRHHGKPVDPGKWLAR